MALYVRMIQFSVIIRVKMGVGRIMLSRKHIEDTFEVLNIKYITYEKNNTTLFAEFFFLNWTK